MNLHLRQVDGCCQRIKEINNILYALTIRTENCQYWQSINNGNKYNIYK